jgi:hypothetical protein
MSMRFLLLLPMMFVAACASYQLSVPQISAPDFSAWFDQGNRIEVADVGRLPDCGGDGGEVRVTLLPDLAAAKDWASAHGVTLAGSDTGQLLDAPYAAVERGVSPSGGYGIAVSREAGVKNGTLVLKATFFEPGPGRWAKQEPANPCSVISLPPREYRSVQLIDQSGALRASTER